jgi:hypothetical protein
MDLLTVCILQAICFQLQLSGYSTYTCGSHRRLLSFSTAAQSFVSCTAKQARSQHPIRERCTRISQATVILAALASTSSTKRSEDNHCSHWEARPSAGETSNSRIPCNVSRRWSTKPSYTWCGPIRDDVGLRSHART